MFYAAYWPYGVNTMWAHDNSDAISEVKAFDLRTDRDGYVSAHAKWTAYPHSKSIRYFANMVFSWWRSVRGCDTVSDYIYCTSAKEIVADYNRMTHEMHGEKRGRHATI